MVTTFLLGNDNDDYRADCADYHADYHDYHGDFDDHCGDFDDYHGDYHGDNDQDGRAAGCKQRQWIVAMDML